ncbi:MAG: ATP-dependent helicase, partial [Flavobacteriales bacterium]|nr:ATP-dependent helicase [Flavobacteriales bacterium]
MRWDDNLEGPAKIIAESDDRLFCVQAGPGTGKSFALQRRIMRLLQEGVIPETIFACTFTNVAANDLQKKILETGIYNAKNVLVGTIHSYCFKVLTRNSVFTGLHRVPRPLLTYELQPLYEDLKGGPFGNKRNVENLVEKFNAAWATRRTENPGWPTDDVEKMFHEEVIKWLKVHKGMLLGELIPLTLNFFRKNPHLPDLTQFKFVFVDEYQDLNRAEQELIRLISTNASLMVVGDVHQSIYSFKYAYPDGIRDFPLNNPGTKTQLLTICRRCPRQVVRLANELIKKNSHSSNAVLEEYKANPEGDVHILNWINNEEETRGIAEIIDKYIHKKGFLPRHIVVLSPAAVFARDLSNKLSEFNIKNRNYFSDIYKLNPAKPDVNKPLIALSLLNLINNPKDLVSLRCLMGFGEVGLL